MTQLLVAVGIDMDMDAPCLPLDASSDVDNHQTGEDQASKIGVCRVPPMVRTGINYIVSVLCFIFICLCLCLLGEFANSV